MQSACVLAVIMQPRVDLGPTGADIEIYKEKKLHALQRCMAHSLCYVHW